jgi:hypothetical protein
LLAAGNTYTAVEFLLSHLFFACNKCHIIGKLTLKPARLIIFTAAYHSAAAYGSGFGSTAAYGLATPRRLVTAYGGFESVMA